MKCCDSACMWYGTMTMVKVDPDTYESDMYEAEGCNHPSIPDDEEYECPFRGEMEMCDKWSPREEGDIDYRLRYREKRVKKSSEVAKELFEKAYPIGCVMQIHKGGFDPRRVCGKWETVLKCWDNDDIDVIRRVG